MIRYFKKELPSNPLYLPSGRRAPFKLSKAGVGLLVTNDSKLLAQLDIMVSRRVGGLIEIDEKEYLDLRRGYKPPHPKRNGVPAAAKAKAAQHQNGAPAKEADWKSSVHPTGRMVFRPVGTGLQTIGKFIHVLERHHQANPNDETRIENAFKSWAYHYERGVIPCHVWEPPRSAARTIGDPRDLPYLKDILAEGLKLATAPDDVLFFTNDDTVLHHDIIPAISVMLKNVDALSSFRMNFEHENMPALDTPTEKVRQWGEACLGRDLFAFRAQWLRLNWDAIPDFILGDMEWDLVLALMVRMAAGVATKPDNFVIQQPRCELDRGYVIHENHTRHWMSDRFAKSPAKLHNYALAAEWKADNGFEAMIGKL